MRKLFSKFRRGPHLQGSKDVPCKESLAAQSDVEKGDGGGVVAGETTDRGKLPAKLTLTEDMRTLGALPSPSPSPSPSSGPPSARGGKASKWGRLLGSSSVDSASDTSAKVAVSRSLSARESLRESVGKGASRDGGGGGGASGGPGNKIFPKATKLAPSPAQSLARQDTIDESGEGGDLVSPMNLPSNREHRLSIDRTGSSERGSMDRNLSLERERQIEMACSRATMIDTYDTGLREQPSTLAERDLVATVMDMKVDMRLEMQRMNQRISKIEDLIGDLVRRLSTEVNTSSVSTPGAALPLPQIEDLSSTYSSNTVVTVGPVIVTSSPVPTPTIESPVTESAAGSSSLGASTSTSGSTSGGGGGGGGSGLGPMLVKKRRSKSRKAPLPPPTRGGGSGGGGSLPEEEKLLESQEETVSGTGARRKEFL